MPNIVRRMMSKGRKSKRPSSDNASVSSGTADSQFSQSRADGGRPSFDSVGSVYSRTASAHNSPRPSGDIERAVQRPNHEYQFDGVEQNPYSYRYNSVDESPAMETDQYQRPDFTNAAPGESIRTTRRSFQPAVVTGRGSSTPFANPIRKPGTQFATPDSGSHGFHLSTQLTTKPDTVIEDEEEEGIQETKKEIRRLKVLDVSSTQNALRLAHQAFDVGLGTLQTLHEQGDRLHHAEENLEQAEKETKTATRKLKELKQADRMLSISNPFTAAKHERNADAEMVAARRQAREQRDAVRAEKWHAWKTTKMHTFTETPLQKGATPQDVLARAKYQFEEDSDDDRIEDVIEGNVGELLVAVKRLKGLAVATHTQLNHHNEVLDRTGPCADRVDDGLASNRARLDRFR